MKLKKILSGFLAAAMAVTSMVTASVTAGAENEELANNVVIDSSSSFVYGKPSWAGDDYPSSMQNIAANVKDSWGTPISCDDYAGIIMEIEVEDIGNAKGINLFVQANPDLDDPCESIYKNTTASGTVTIDFAALEGKNFAQIGYQVLPNDEVTAKTEDVAFTGKITIKSIILEEKVADTTVYANQEVAINSTGDAQLGGMFNSANISGSGAYIEIYWVSDAASSGMKIIPAEDYDNPIAMENGTSTVGEQVSKFMLKNISDKINGKLWLNTWGCASITKMIIHNDATKENVYDDSPTYAVKIDEIENGTVVADVKYAKENATVTLTVTPDEGYEVDQIVLWSWGGEKLFDVDVSKKPCTFTMPGTNLTVAATFKAAATKYDITVTAPTNGTVTVKNADGTAVEKAAEGDEITITATANTGYVLDTLKVNGTAVTAAADGSYTHTMTAANTTVEATFKVKEVPLTAITLDETVAVVVGDTTKLTATKVPENTTVKTDITWTSSDETVAAVASDGTVSGLKAGTATITAACGEIKATCEVTVTAEAKPCTDVTLDKTTAEVKKGETVTLKATKTPTDTTDKITWITSDASVATVADGVVTGVARGTATITVKCGEKTATCEVSVTEDKTVASPVAAGGQKSYEVVSTVNGKEVKTVDTVYAITEADLACKGYQVTITNPTNGKTITREIKNAYKSVTVKSAEDLGNDTFTGYYLVVRVTNVPKDVNLSYAFNKIS